jgi:hypothetical protein
LKDWAAVAATVVAIPMRLQWRAAVVESAPSLKLNIRQIPSIQGRPEWVKVVPVFVEISGVAIACSQRESCYSSWSEEIRLTLMENWERQVAPITENRLP